MQKLHGQMTRESLGLKLWNFQGIAFIWTQIYMEIFKSLNFYFLRKILTEATFCYLINFQSICNEAFVNMFYQINSYYFHPRRIFQT